MKRSELSSPSSAGTDWEIFLEIAHYLLLSFVVVLLIMVKGIRIKLPRRIGQVEKMNV